MMRYIAKNFEARLKQGASVSLILLAGISVSVLAHGGPQTPLSQPALFQRCYKQFTRKKAPDSHPLYLQVKAGTKRAVDACMQVLASANLNSSGLLPNPLDEEARSVLDKFSQIHRLWFEVADLSGRPLNGSMGETRHQDPVEPSLFLTRALFQPGVRYSSIVTANESLRGVRNQKSWVYMTRVGGNDNFSVVPEGGIQKGELIGIVPYSAEMNSTWVSDTGRKIATLISQRIFPASGPSFDYTYQSQRTYGGGILGLSSYVMMNSGFPDRRALSDGAIRMHRRWAGNFLSDLMCRSLPALRTSDVSPMVTDYLSANPDASKHIQFRTATTCMSCHASIDSSAAVIRNIGFGDNMLQDWHDDGDSVWADDSMFVRAHGISGAATSNDFHLQTELKNYHLTPPSGMLYYRSYDGTKPPVKELVSGASSLDALTKLGAKIAGTNDFYVCAAAKYFKALTNIDVSLMDDGDPRNSPLPEKDQAYRKLVIEIGLRFKEHDDLRKLILDILETDLYQSTSQRSP